LSTVTSTEDVIVADPTTMSKANGIATSKQVVVFPFIDSLRIFEDKCFAVDIIFAKAKESVLGSPPLLYSPWTDTFQEDIT
jgi:hypothetical protein